MPSRFQTIQEIYIFVKAYRYGLSNKKTRPRVPPFLSEGGATVVGSALVAREPLGGEQAGPTRLEHVLGGALAGLQPVDDHVGVHVVPVTARAVVVARVAGFREHVPGERRLLLRRLRLLPRELGGTRPALARLGRRARGAQAEDLLGVRAIRATDRAVALLGAAAPVELVLVDPGELRGRRRGGLLRRWAASFLRLCRALPRELPKRPSCWRSSRRSKRVIGPWGNKRGEVVRT